jgi:hypothetical protein
MELCDEKNASDEANAVAPRVGVESGSHTCIAEAGRKNKMG